MLASLTLSLRRDVHPVLDLHVSAEVPLQVELTGTVRTLEGLAASVEMHVAQQVVHSVKRLATHLGGGVGSGVEWSEGQNTHKSRVVNTRAS